MENISCKIEQYCQYIIFLFWICLYEWLCDCEIRCSLFLILWHLLSLKCVLTSLDFVEIYIHVPLNNKTHTVFQAIILQFVSHFLKPLLFDLQLFILSQGFSVFSMLWNYLDLMLVKALFTFISYVTRQVFLGLV